MAVAASVLVGRCLAAEKNPQTITFNSPGDQLMSHDPIQLSATSTSGQPPTFTSDTTSVCTVTPDGRLTTVAAGLCTITANQAGSETVAAATPVQRSFLLTKRPQTITFDGPGDQSLGHPVPPLSATAESGRTPLFTAGPPGVCSVAGNILTLLAADSTGCQVMASESGDNVWAAATPVSRVFKVKSQFPGVDLVFGIGSLITANRTSYTLNTSSSPNTLQGGQIGAASPQLLAGVSFQLPFQNPFHKKAAGDAKWADDPRPFHVFTSLKFSPGTGSSLVGYTFGGTYRLQKYLDVLMGYTLTQFQEPSPGFRAAAIAAVQANANPNLFPGFSVPAMNNNLAGAFDGFPTQCPAGAKTCGITTTSSAANGAAVGTALYTGQILEPHYRGGIMIGISVPVSLKGIFGIPNN